MSLKSTPKKKYLYSSIIGVLLVLISTYLFINAFKEKDDFNLFVKGVLLTAWLVYTINSLIQHRKASKNSNADQPN